MSQVSRRLGVLALSCALLAAAGCSKKLGTPFDPVAGHPGGFFQNHSAAYRSSGGSCKDCHGADLLGGISAASCFSASRDSQICHPGGPGGHPADWLGLHTAIDPVQASACAACHDNPANSLPPNCFNTSLCHGAQSSHPSGWRSSHTKTSTGQASACAECHRENSGTPGCFNNTLCHGEEEEDEEGEDGEDDEDDD